jgi:hypothetical protein
MPGKPISVDYIRDIFNISPEEITDAELRRAARRPAPCAPILNPSA